MTGVGVAPAAMTRSRQATWSSICEAHATWCTVPAPPMPAPLDRDTLGAEPLRPEVERALGADAPGDRVDHPGPRPSAPGVRVLEEGDVAARAPDLVGVEEVVDGRVVLVDGLLDEPEAQRAGVELDVAWCVRRDARDVVDPLKLHRSQLRVLGRRSSRARGVARPPDPISRRASEAVRRTRTRTSPSAG